jgi:hypothetical protein
VRSFVWRRYTELARIGSKTSSDSTVGKITIYRYMVLNPNRAESGSLGVGERERESRLSRTLSTYSKTPPSRSAPRFTALDFEPDSE